VQTRNPGPNARGAQAEERPKIALSSGTSLDATARVSWIPAILILGGLVVYFMTPAERAALVRRCQRLLQQAWSEVVRRRTRCPGEAAQPAAPLPLATWCIAIANLSVFVAMYWGGAFGSPEALVSWGASVGPRTTNGEWWRLATAIFVHGSTLHMLAVLGGLIPVGCFTERLVGPFALLSVYVAAGTLAGLVRLSSSPVTVTAGGSAAVLGIYGLLTATLVWSLLRGSRVRISWRAAKRILLGVALFVVYTVVTGGVGPAAAAAAAAGGAISGLLMAKGAVDHKPAARRVALLVVDTVALIVLFAVPLRGMADVKPEIRRLLAIEEQATRRFDAALDRFRNKPIPTAELAQLIDLTILPDIRSARHDLAALERVPRDHQRLVAAADQYLRLCDETWRLRSEGLRTSRMRLLQDAGRKEGEARDALRQLTDVNR
jgi:rhomboid protease GluP